MSITSTTLHTLNKHVVTRGSKKIMWKLFSKNAKIQHVFPQSNYQRIQLPYQGGKSYTLL